jgi:glucokinase
MYILGFDIGGTKCAAITAHWENEKIELLERVSCPTEHCPPEEMLEKLIALADTILIKTPDRIGISCGGPLDSKAGIIMSPPNLPLWDNVEIVKIMKEHYGVPVTLQNDANACAVAEWKFGAGRGKKNVVFLTFGTGLGAGLILDGHLYTGTNDNAGEVGHIRLDSFGPVGYGKAGSFEGFCSGGGIAQLGVLKAKELEQIGKYPAFYKKGMSYSEISAKTIAIAADEGDETAIEVYKICGEHLGRGLSVIIDILNPEVIVIGSIFGRSHSLLWEHTKKMIDKEALGLSASVCKVVPGELGEKIGDFAAVATAVI